MYILFLKARIHFLFVIVNGNIPFVWMGVTPAGTDQQSHHAAEDRRVHQQNAAGESPTARRGPETEGGDPAPQLFNQVGL